MKKLPTVLGGLFGFFLFSLLPIGLFWFGVRRSISFDLRFDVRFPLVPEEARLFHLSIADWKLSIQGFGCISLLGNGRNRCITSRLFGSRFSMSWSRSASQFLVMSSNVLLIYQFVNPERGILKKNRR